MPSNARCVEPGLAYHVLRQHCVDAEVRVLAYCLMSNHVHLVVVPGRADSLAVLFRRVHGRYAQYLNIRRQRSGHLWQSRFFSCALSESHLWVALRYVEQNPCRACIAGTPGEYRWSSYSANCSIRLDDFVSPHPAFLALAGVLPCPVTGRAPPPIPLCVP